MLNKILDPKCFCSFINIRWNKLWNMFPNSKEFKSNNIIKVLQRNLWRYLPIKVPISCKPASLLKNEFIYRYFSRFLINFYSHIQRISSGTLLAYRAVLSSRGYNQLPLCLNTAWKVSKYGVFSGPYFPTFEPYSVQMQKNTDQMKLRIWNISRSETHHQQISVLKNKPCYL